MFSVTKIVFFAFFIDTIFFETHIGIGRRKSIDQTPDGGRVPKGVFDVWKFGSLGLKILRMFHFLLIVLFLGGILSSFALLLRLDLSNYIDVYTSYRVFNIISDNVVKIGAQGTILLGAIYGFFTRWGFTKHKWLALKWLLFITQTFIGIIIVDKLMVSNLALLETEKAMALHDPFLFTITISGFMWSSRKLD